MKRGLAAVFGLCALFPLAAQVGIELHGSVETFGAFSFSQDFDLTDSRASFTGEVSACADRASAFVSLSAEYNGASPDRSGFSLGEAWVDWNAGGFNLRLGRQLLSWGTADGLILTDVVCPPNLTAYAGLDFAGSRLAVDGVKLRYSFPVLAVEGVWLPLFTPARLPGDPRNPLHEIFYPPSVDMNGRIPVFMADAAPPWSIADGEYGLRVSWYTPALDFSCMAFYGWNDIPYTEKKLIPPGIELTPGYGRTVTAGADAGIPLGDFLLRLEAAWTGGGRYDPPAGETAAALRGGQIGDPVVRHNLKALAGIDWNPSGWTLSAQYYEDLLPDARGGGTARPWRKNGISLRIAKGFFRETLHISAWGYLDLADFDTAGSLSADYALTDALSLSWGTDFFTGGIDNRGSYAAYRELSCGWFRGIFRF
ncbi:MAG: hypothetical protein LBP71_06865 [Spirochaetaceae bacterium]|jgi:hypothetical protein|nr:hypothetical protein [Spirochaetaceae bacterium]